MQTFDQWYTAITVEGDMKHNMRRAWDAALSVRPGAISKDEALQQSANVAIKFTRVPRDCLGPATAAMKAKAALGEKIAAAILAL